MRKPQRIFRSNFEIINNRKNKTKKLVDCKTCSRLAKVIISAIKDICVTKKLSQGGAYLLLYGHEYHLRWNTRTRISMFVMFIVTNEVLLVIRVVGMNAGSRFLLDKWSHPQRYSSFSCFCSCLRLSARPRKDSAEQHMSDMYMTILKQGPMLLVEFYH